MPTNTQHSQEITHTAVNALGETATVRELRMRRQQVDFEIYQKRIACEMRSFSANLAAGYVREPIPEFSSIIDKMSIANYPNANKKIIYQLEKDKVVCSDQMNLTSNQLKDISRLLTGLYMKYKLVKNLSLVEVSVAAPAPAVTAPSITTTPEPAMASLVPAIDAAPAPMVAEPPVLVMEEPQLVVPMIDEARVSATASMLVDQSVLVRELQSRLEEAEQALQTARQAIATRELEHQNRLIELSRQHAQKVQEQTDLITDLQDRLEETQHALQTANQAIVTRKLVHQERLTELSQQYEQKIQALNKIQSSLESACAALKDENHRTNERLEQLQVALLASQSDTTRQTSELKEQVQGVKAALHQKDLENSALQAEVTALQRENHDVEQRVAEASSRLITLQADFDAQRVRLAENVQEQKAVQATLAQREQEVAELQRVLQDEKAQTQHMTTMSAHAISKLQQTTTAQKSELEGAKALILQLQAQLEQEQAEHARATEALQVSRLLLQSEPEASPTEGVSEQVELPIIQEGEQPAPGITRQLTSMFDEDSTETEVVEAHSKLLHSQLEELPVLARQKTSLFDEETTEEGDDEAQVDALGSEPVDDALFVHVDDTPENTLTTPNVVDDAAATSDLAGHVTSIADGSVEPNDGDMEDVHSVHEQTMLRAQAEQVETDRHHQDMSNIPMPIQNHVDDNEALSRLKNITLSDIEVMRHLKCLIETVEGISTLRASERASISTERVGRLLEDTNTLLQCENPIQRQTLLQNYQTNIRDLPGHPSPWMKALGAVVMALSAALIACAWVVTIPVPFAAPALTAAGVLGFGTGASFFKKGFVKQNSLYAASNALASALTDVSSAESESSDSSSDSRSVNDVMETLGA